MMKPGRQALWQGESEQRGAVYAGAGGCGRNYVMMDHNKKLPVVSGKAEIKLKSNPKADAVKRAPDEVIAMAIRDAMLKDKENK